MYINRGSTINLTCVVEHSPEPPANILWTHNNQVRSTGMLQAVFNVLLNW